MLIEDLIFGIWITPKNTKSTIHRILKGNQKKKADPVHAKVKILGVLHVFDWKTNKQIALETGLQLNTVQQKTAKLYELGKIDRVMQKNKGDIKPICLYRIK